MKVVLSLGSNLGESEATLRAAIEELTRVVQVDAVSSFVYTQPQGVVDQPEFVNCVVLCETELAPMELLAAVQRIELAAGRTREVRWGPRTLDIDLIMCDDLTSDDPDLTLPHPRAHERAFVLVPWCEIDPDAVLPGYGRIDALIPNVASQGVRR